ncbi:MAG: TonB-dependent receptor [Elusimicrobiota bacterium]
MKISALVSLLIVFLSSIPATVSAADVVIHSAVTGTKTPVMFSHLTRNVSVITAKEIMVLPVQSVAELLGYITSADIQSRGLPGVQADLSFRGSNYAQTLVLLDGVRMNDPQTAHHNMDLPIAVNDIDRIEILHGQGTVTHGADAFGGVVNIITKTKVNHENDRETGITAKVESAQYNTYSVQANVNTKLQSVSQTVSLSSSKSDGTRYDTDYNNSTFYSNTAVVTGNNESTLSLGAMDKAFGAYDFYTPGLNYPSKEWTQTYYAGLRSKQRINNSVALNSVIYYRRHNDKFMLDLRTPTKYVNDHVTHVTGVELGAVVSLPSVGNVSLTLDTVNDMITSTRLGERSKQRYAFATELISSLSINSDLHAGMRYEMSAWGGMFAPTVGYGYWINSDIKLIGSVGRSYRVASFTELYYTDPVNFGNPNLVPEESVNTELTAKYWTGKTASAVSTIFYRSQTNIIDWVGDTDKGPWRATNIGESYVYGVETELKTVSANNVLSLSYTYARTVTMQSYYSKYAQNYPVHNIVFSITSNIIPRVFTPTIAVLYKQRVNDAGYIVVNAKLSRVVFKNALSLFLLCTNITDVQYEDVKGIPAPGRLVSGGLEWSF